MEVLAWVRNFFPIYSLAKIGSAGRVSLPTGTGFLHINRALGSKSGIWEETKTEKGWGETSLFLFSQFSWWPASLDLTRTRRIVYRLSDKRQSRSLDGLISVCKNLQRRLLMFLFIKKVHISTESLLIDKHKTSDRLSNWFCLPWEGVLIFITFWT